MTTPEGNQSKLRRLFFLVALVALLIPGVGLSNTSTTPALLIKTSFLLNFLKFTQWPASSFASADQPLLVVVLGNAPITPIIQSNLDGQLVNDRRIKVSVYPHHKAWHLSGDQPHALFLTTTIISSWPEIAAALSFSPVLTMADSPHFCAQGGMLNLFQQEDKIRFEANPMAARRASIGLSAQMLKLAVIVQPEEKK